MKDKAQYKDFGILLTGLRQEAGITKQLELAKLLKTTQQTISRWESGLSRPRDKQIPLIAATLNTDASKLLSAAGYIHKATTSPFDQPFPVSALNPDSFERFCFYFLAKRYPTAEVNRAGGTGHTQEGIDIDAIFPNEDVYTFQCKRVQQFGPKDVHEAAAQHIREADKKFLLLSRVASPQARTAIRLHQSWTIWDTEDISREIRQNLTKSEQIKLVDIFFPGQRLALLGEREAGPWQTPTEFFAPFMAVGSVFSHKWNLVGRTQEPQDVVTALSDTKKQAILLVGAGGAGKSRVLKEAIETYQDANKSVQISFLSPRNEITEKSLEDLGKVKKLLVVDDAHDESNLHPLFQYVASPTNDAKLLLVFRPYGLVYIKAQASSFALCGDTIDTIKLDPLTIVQATELASIVLKEFNGPESAAEHIAGLTLDCPLATVIGSQIVATEKINHLELLKNEEKFHTTIFGKFRDIIAGDIGSKGDEEPIRKLLKVLALIQPFHPDDNSVATIVDKVEGIRTHEVNRLILLLTNAGVLFKRGGQYRLSPDLLADFVIEDSCIGHNGASTGYAEVVFDSASDTHIKNILLNLGKLDWRRADGYPRNSKLMDGIWQRLKPHSKYADPYIGAVTAVAYYQPDRALAFAEQLMREDSYLSQLPHIIKYAAYNFDHLRPACELLWQLGKDDNRQLSQHPEHAIRVLAEMCAVEQNKPFEYNEAVVDFAIALIKDDDSWNHIYTPFDILKNILATEVSITKSEGRSFSFTNAPVTYLFVAPLRDKVIDTTIKLLSSSTTKVAVSAARFLSEGLRYYSRSGDTKHHKSWEKAFVKTLKNIEQATQEETLDPLVLIEITRSVSWHANFAKNKTTTPIAKRINRALPNSLTFRTTLALIDGYGRLREREDFERSQREWDTHLDSLATDLLATYPNGEHLRVFLEEILSHIELNFGNGNRSPFTLYGHLINTDISIAKATVTDAIENPSSRTMKFADMALAKLLSEDHDNALDIAARFIETKSLDLIAAVANAYSRLNFKKEDYGSKDLTLLQNVLMTSDERIARSAVNAVRVLAKNDQRLAIDLLKKVDIGMSSSVADDTLALFCHGEIIPFHTLTKEDIDCFLNKLMRLSELDGYWVETFLSESSKSHANRTATFFMARVEHTEKIQDWKYRPCNYGPYNNVPLRFRESPECDSLLRQVAQWMKTGKEGYMFMDNAAKLFEAMFKPFDAELVSFLQNWLGMASSEDIHIISQILNELPSVIFEHQSFTMQFLEKAQQCGKEKLDGAISALIGSAISGVRSGTVGEPFPLDIELKKKAETLLKEIPRYSPAYRLYESLREHAEQSIKRSLREGERFEN